MICNENSNNNIIENNQLKKTLKNNNNNNNKTSLYFDMKLKQKDINMNYWLINSLLHQHITSQSYCTSIIRIREKDFKK